MLTCCPHSSRCSCTASATAGTSPRRFHTSALFPRRISRTPLTEPYILDFAIGDRGSSLQRGNHGLAGDHLVTDRHAEAGVGREEDVHARAELHDAEALPRLEFGSWLHAAHDAARQNADDLP